MPIERARRGVIYYYRPAGACGNASAAHCDDECAAARAVVLQVEAQSVKAYDCTSRNGKMG